MDLTFRKLTRTEIVEQLNRCRAMAKEADGKPVVDMDVIVMRRDGLREVLVDFKVDGVGRFTRTTHAIAMIGALTGAGTGPMSLLEVVRSLSATGVPEEIRIGRSAVGKILAVGSGGEYVVTLVPVPENIEEVNAYVHGLVSSKCKDAAGGLECGGCPCVSYCRLLADADEAARLHFGS